MSNEKLAYTVVYRVFPSLKAKFHEILDIRRNSDCDPCPYSTLSPSHLTSNSRPTRFGGNRVAQTRNQIIQARISISKTNKANLISSLGNSISTESGRTGIRGEMRGRQGGVRTWITVWISPYIQNFVEFSLQRRKNSVNNCICQFLI